MGVEKLSATMQNLTTTLAIEAIFGKNIFTDKRKFILSRRSR